jgi:RimJ/RimL family protein N-acetyltransferase
MSVPEIETSRLRLRAFSSGDLDDLDLIFSDADVVKYLPGGKTRTRAETQMGLLHLIAEVKKHDFGLRAVVAKDLGKVIGYSGLMFLEKTGEIEVAYGLAKSHWGKGLATEAAGASLRYGFEELELERIVAVVDPQNVASQRVLEKLGMTYARNGSHYGADLKYYEILKSSYQPGPTPYLIQR